MTIKLLFVFTLWISFINAWPGSFDELKMESASELVIRYGPQSSFGTIHYVSPEEAASHFSELTKCDLRHNKEQESFEMIKLLANFGLCEWQVRLSDIYLRGRSWHQRDHYRGKDYLAEAIKNKHQIPRWDTDMMQLLASIQGFLTPEEQLSIQFGSLLEI
jgi:hypothetical protein